MSFNKQELNLTELNPWSEFAIEKVWSDLREVMLSF